jgi:hypothetical protein
MTKLRRLIEKLFYLVQWNVGTAEVPLDAVLCSGKLPRITWWEADSKLIFCADPFFLGDDVLCERMNYWRGKAEIWIANARGECRRRFIRTTGHISYPCVTTCNGRTFLLYESSNAGYCRILEWIVGEWKEVSRIYEAVVDGTLLQHEGRYWVFGTLAGGKVNRDLYVWWADSIGGPWHSHSANPVKQDESSSRPAGGFYRSRTGLIRPAQDCGTTYGAGIALCRVQRLDEQRFEETVVTRLTPDEGFLGIHTINSNGNRIIIDAKRLVFHAMTPFLKLRSMATRRPAARPVDSDGEVLASRHATAGALGSRR